MGCCPWAKNSVAPADKAQSGKAAQKYVQRGEHAVRAPAVKAASPEELTSRVLDSLAASSKRVSVPVLSQAERRGPGRRGLSRAALRGFRMFFERHNALDKAMAEVCNGLAVSACELTKSTGLSLAETLVLVAGGGKGIEQVVGDATSFFSYSWTGTKLRDLLDAMERALKKLEADGRPRFVWIDIFCASQNLLSGVMKFPGATTVSDATRAEILRAEVGIEEAIQAANEILFYFEPLAGEWTAPPHPFLLAEQGEPREGWVRRGPAALTRAWCIYELAKSFTKRCTLHVLLSAESLKQFETRLNQRGSEGGGFDWIGKILADIDVKLAQISFVGDRDYILGEVAKLDGGMGAINSNVMGALQGWLSTEAMELLDHLPKEERGTSLLINNLAGMLENSGRLQEAEDLYRERLLACRAKLGGLHEYTRAVLASLGFNLYNQGKLKEAEVFLRESVAAHREVSDLDKEGTIIDVGFLGMVLRELGKLDEAEPFCIQATAWLREKVGSQQLSTVMQVSNLVELRREQGRLTEAQHELGSLVADARAGIGPQHFATLEAEAIAARLQHEQPDDDGKGVAELRAVVERMREFLGPTHQYTVKYGVVLDQMSS